MKAICSKSSKSRHAVFTYLPESAVSVRNRIVVMVDPLKVPVLCESVLVAEDNDDHVLLIKRAFLHACFLNPLHFVRDGAEAVAYLNGDGKYADRTQFPLPGLLLLDLKMPNLNGFEVMEWIREQPALGNLRIVVLTTSDHVYDVQRAYDLGAASFLVKPVDFRDFVQLGPSLKGFWIWTNNPGVRHPLVPDQLGPRTTVAPSEPLSPSGSH